MWSRLPLPLFAVTIFSAALVLPLTAQVPNPVLPGPSGSGDGLTRDALETSAAPQPAPANNAAQRSTARRTTPHRSSTAGSSSKNSTTYATISRHRHRHRSKSRSTNMVASASRNVPARHPGRKRAPLVSFIYWWNGWVVRTFHTRSGTVLLDTIGAKS